MAFTKLDDGLVFSSLMDEDDSVFKIWVIILSLTKQDGICRISPTFLHKITGKDYDEIERCLKVLESPDENSRTKEHEGRRIERIDGGFFVLNYHLYRAVDYNEHEAARKRESRKNSKKTAVCPDVSGKRPDCSASASSSASSSVPEKRGSGGEKEVQAAVPFIQPGPVAVLLTEEFRVALTMVVPDIILEPQERFAWSVDMQQILNDGKKADQIRKKWAWCFTDKFWFNKVLSPGKLREFWNKGKLTAAGNGHKDASAMANAFPD